MQELIERFGTVLLDLAAASIRHGVGAGRALGVAPAEFSDDLWRPGASFVTLHLDGRLRGCTGSAVACQPLARDVAENAYASAFTDPRFDPVAAPEVDRLDTEISLLTAPEPMRFTSESDLLAQLVPGRDGLILEAGGQRGLFLPQVWDTVPDAADFLAHLKIKAGLKENFWSESVRVRRFYAHKTGRA